MTSITKNVYIDKLDNIVNKYNNRYHRTIKTKSVNINPSIYIDFNKDNNKKGHKFKVGDNIRISKYKNIFAKGCSPNLSEEGFVVKNLKNTVPWTYVISDFNGEEIAGTFYSKELQNNNNNNNKKFKKSLELKE